MLFYLVKNPTANIKRKFSAVGKKHKEFRLAFVKVAAENNNPDRFLRNEFFRFQPL